VEGTAVSLQRDLTVLW